MPGGWTYWKPCDPAAIISDARNQTQVECLSTEILAEHGKRTVSAEPWHVRAARSALTALAKLGTGT
jgi:hypothetical protein